MYLIRYIGTGMPLPGERTPHGNVNLLGSVSVEGDRDPFEGLVPALGAEHLVHEGGGAETGVAPQNPRLCLLKEEISVRMLIKNFFTDK